MSDVHCRGCEINDRERPKWGHGPWQDEPSRHEFEHAGLPCILHRGGGGAWCGYAAVPPGHPDHGKSYDDVEVDVHGGLTYAEACRGHICHVPKPGGPDNVYWFGFDCSHSDDIRPSDKMLREMCPELSSLHDMREHYWTMTEVVEETKRLAEQLAARA